MWEINDEYDLVAQCDTINFLCFKKDILNQIKREPITIGIYTFRPGRPYHKFGSTKKTSSGFIHFESDEPLYYYGHYDEHILFTKTGTPVKDKEGYKYIFFTWAFDTERTLLVATNQHSAGRIMEMNQ